MKILSINVGRAETIGTGRRSTTSGINKRPATAPVMIDSGGLEADKICNTEFHGGPDQAVYVYRAEDYAWWATKLGREIAPGTFGDNLTISGLPQDLDAGDLLKTADVVLEATAPRIPCETLAAQMADRKFGLTFRRAERPGFYFRVNRAGTVAVGDTVDLIPTAGPSVSMLELFRLAFAVEPSAEDLQRAIAAPIATRMREKFEERLTS